jgi:hypothetical protein
MRQWIRSHLTYANVMATIAVFLVLSGGTAIALDGSNTVFSDDIVNGEVKNGDIGLNEVKANNVAPDSLGGNKIVDRSVKNADLSLGASSSNTIADGGIQGVDVKNDTLTGTQVQESTLFNDNSLTDADIQNPTRSVNLPLGSFLDMTNQKAIDFTSGVDRDPDFAKVNDVLVIEYDDDSGNEDDGSIGTTFQVPSDYASGGSLALRASKDAHTTGVDEFISCFNKVNSDPSFFSSSAEITTSDNTAYTVPSTAPYAAGDSVGVNCSALGIEAPQDDIVRIHSIEFRYTATQ